MRIRQKLTAALTAALLLFHISPLSYVCAGQPETDTLPDPAMEEGEDSPSFRDPPLFRSHIEYTGQGWVVIGSTAGLTPDIIRIQPLYSLDGVSYQTSGNDWNLQWLGTEDPSELESLHNQTCLYPHREPLKSYLAGTCSRFYLKLLITKENGLSYETQTAVIEQGSPQPVPEGMTVIAKFAPSAAVRIMRPPRYYGRYQLTVRAGASAEEISSLLPDTLPVEVQLYTGIDFFASAAVDCPVTWKSLSFPQPAAGESVTIPDAAEAITVPEGTLLNTPLGIFRLEEPLPLDAPPSSDEVELILNAVLADGNPAGVLREEISGLEMAFDQKPAGAVSIQAYIWKEGDPEWSGLPDLPLLEAANAQPATASSGYTLILRKDQEPYRSYLAAVEAQEAPVPFLIGLRIEGGVFDGRTLILPYPGTYEFPPDLSGPGGAGGNEGNAGSPNKGDSTETGQRPDLPQQPDTPLQSFDPPDQTELSSSDPPAGPEESPGAQSARPNTSGAQTETSGAQTKVPDAQTEVPDAQVKVPGAQTEVPDAQTKVPGAQMEVPDAKTEMSDAQAETPDAKT